MRLRYFIILINLIFVGNALAQNDNNCSCCTESHKAFDFWIGDWIVYNTSGKVVGTNEIIKLQDSCILQENWIAASKTNTGSSYNYYNTKDSTWNQVWISNSGNVLELKGNLNEKGDMVLKSDLVSGKKGNYYNQISWSKDEKGNVIQQWDILNEEGEKLKTLFKGIYKRTDQH